MSEWCMTDEQATKLSIEINPAFGSDVSAHKERDVILRARERMNAMVKEYVETAVRIGIVVPARDGEERLRAAVPTWKYTHDFDDWYDAEIGGDRKLTIVQEEVRVARLAWEAALEVSRVPEGPR